MRRSFPIVPHDLAQLPSRRPTPWVKRSMAAMPVLKEMSCCEQAEPFAVLGQAADATDQHPRRSDRHLLAVDVDAALRGSVRMATSVRPAPTSPAKPKISPFLTSKDVGTTLTADRFSTRRTTSSEIGLVVGRRGHLVTDHHLTAYRIW